MGRRSFLGGMSLVLFGLLAFSLVGCGSSSPVDSSSPDINVSGNLDYVQAASDLEPLAVGMQGAVNETAASSTNLEDVLAGKSFGVGSLAAGTGKNKTSATEEAWKTVSGSYTYATANTTNEITATVEATLSLQLQDKNGVPLPFIFTRANLLQVKKLNTRELLNTYISVFRPTTEAYNNFAYRSSWNRLFSLEKTGVPMIISTLANGVMTFTGSVESTLSITDMVSTKKITLALKQYSVTTTGKWSLKSGKATHVYSGSFLMTNSSDASMNVTSDIYMDGTKVGVLVYTPEEGVIITLNNGRQIKFRHIRGSRP